MFLALLKSLKSDFIRKGANFQEGVVGGKMNSKAIGQGVKVVSYGTVNNMLHGFCSN